MDSQVHEKPIDVIEAFISDMEALRAGRLNPDKPEGWLPWEQWYVAKRLAQRNHFEVELILIEVCGSDEAAYWLGCLADHLEKLQGFAGILQRDYPKRDLNDERRFRAIYAGREWKNWKQSVRDLVRERPAPPSDAASPAKDEDANAQPVPDDGEESARAYWASSDIAKKHEISAGALRKRLDRRRRDHKLSDDVWIENANKGAREPGFLYRPAGVMDEVRALQSKHPMSSDRPTKKK